MLVTPSNFISSPNFFRGRKGTEIKNIVIYCLRRAGLARTVDTCLVKKENTSYHFIVGVDGHTVQTVRIINKACPAKGSFFYSSDNESISIAIVGAGNIFTNDQYSSLFSIIFLLVKVLGIKEEGLLYYDPPEIDGLQACSWEILSNTLFSVAACKNPFIV